MPLAINWEPLLAWLLGSGVRILIIIVVSLVASYLLKGVGRYIEKLVEDKDVAVGEREQRAKTITSLLRRTGQVLIVTIAGIMVLSELGINVGPIIAGAGVVGIALGFGAQTLVKDVIAGLFILLENQFAEGDSVTIGGLSGGVEKMTLRATFIRDFQGTLHIIPNGETRIVANHSRGWARAVVNVGVAYGEDIDRVMATLRRIGQGIWQSETYRPLLMEKPTVSGPEELGDSAITFRIMAKTHPGEQWDISRELRKRVKETFQKEGIEM